MKRAFDIIIGASLLILFSPLMIITAILVKKKLGSPILFKQERPGYNEIPFYIYKYRSMTNSKDENGVLLPNEMRMTQFGSILRKTSLDELPQLFNVLKGELSLVGPRPLRMEYLDLYNDRQKKRHLVKPGITGWAQVNGRNAISWEERFELDVWYVENKSFKLDLYIIFLTIVKVLKRKDISAEGSVSMEKFLGNKK